MKHGNRLLKPVVSIVICSIFILVAGFSWLPTSAAPDELEYDFVVNGNITADTTWSGDVHIISRVTVQSGVTLTIDPGTMVYFQAYQGYREPEKRLSLVVDGSLDANGTAENPVYFTSDAGENDTNLKTNGDWFMLAAYNSPHFHLHYSVVEFSVEGFNAGTSIVEITNSVFRWNNKHGIQAGGDSTMITIDTCEVYANGWGGIQNGNQSNILASHCEIYDINGAGTYTFDDAITEFQESFFHDNETGVTVGNHGEVNLFGIRFEDVNCGINNHGVDSTLRYDLTKLTFINVGTQFCSATGTEVTTIYDPPTSIVLGFTPDITHDLGYIPGDPADRYPYVYDSTDETRTVIDRIGSGSHPGGLAWDGTYLWAAEQGTVMKYDITDGTSTGFSPLLHLTYGKPESFRGLTFDDEGYLWGIDGYQDKVYKIDPVGEDVEFSFPAPNASNGGVTGLEWDGSRLCMLSIGGVPTIIYCTDKTGVILESITLTGSAQSELTLVNGFWLTGGDPVMNIYDRFGRRVGWIYAPAFQTTGLVWDGEFLWVSTETYHSWDDEKLFKVQILDDHHHQAFLPLTIKP